MAFARLPASYLQENEARGHIFLSATFWYGEYGRVVGWTMPRQARPETVSSASMAAPLSVIRARRSPRFMNACDSPCTRLSAVFFEIPLQMAALTHDPAESTALAGYARFRRRGGQMGVGYRQRSACGAGSVGFSQWGIRGCGSSVAIARRAFPGAGCAARLGRCVGQAWARLFELQQERFGEKRTQAYRVKPGRGTGIADESDGAAHTEFLIQVA